MPNTKQTWDQNLRVSLKQDEAVLKGLTIENGRGSLKLNLRSTRYGNGKRTFKKRPLLDLKEGHDREGRPAGF